MLIENNPLLGQEWDKVLAGRKCLPDCCRIPLLVFGEYRGARQWQHSGRSLL